MKHWSGSDVMDRDVLEGDTILTPDDPHPAYRGAKLTNGDDILYEIEIIPGTDRIENIVHPGSFTTVSTTVVDVLYRVWIDDTHSWDELKVPAALDAWGYDDIPINNTQKQISKFDAAMKGI